jgi:5-methylcytosine-specific restriction protein A
VAQRKRLSTADRVRIFGAADGLCHLCLGKILTGEPWEVSHPKPLEMGGEDTDENRRPAHKVCHRDHTSRVDIPQIAKAKRRQARHLGIKKHTSRPMPGSRASGWKRKFDGTVERRS